MSQDHVMNGKVKIVILAGGIGSRLWPLSKNDYPKQFLALSGDKSLLQLTIERYIYEEFCEDIIISTNTSFADLVQEQIRPYVKIKKCHVLVEPVQKNTLGAIALACSYISEKLQGKNSHVLVLPSDHFLENTQEFINHLHKSSAYLSKGKIVLFGISPYKPETGYGYIQTGKKLPFSAFSVEAFLEKPAKEKAKEYLLSRKYLWNSGMFAFSIETFEKELFLHEKAAATLYQSGFSSFQNTFSLLPSQSFDYAILEKSKNLVVYPVKTAWSDIGSWDSVYEALSKDENQNVTSGNVITVETKNSLILGGKKLITTIGLEDLLIVETEEAIFIGKKGESQKVRQLVKQVLHRAKEMQKETSKKTSQE